MTITAVDRFKLPYILQVRPSPEFSYEAAKTKLADIRIGSLQANRLSYITPADAETAACFDDETEEYGVGRRSTLMRLAGCIDVDSHVTVAEDPVCLELFRLTITGRLFRGCVDLSSAEKSHRLSPRR